MKTLLITGGNGLLGTKLLTAASERYHLVSLDLQEETVLRTVDLRYIRADITDRTTIRNAILDAGPDGVIHTAAYTHVDGCETDSDRAHAVMVDGTRHVAEACREAGARMIHLSTDYVFDGTSGPYGEEDTTNPLSAYGRFKLESEQIVLDTLEDLAVVRTMVLYGFAPDVRDNFATWLVRALQNGEAVTIVTDQTGHPTLVDDLAAACLVLFEKKAKGIFHAAGSQWMSRFDFAILLAGVFGLDPSLIGQTTTDRLRQSASRPLVSGLKTDKIRKAFGVRFSTCEEGLRIMKRQMEEAGAFRGAAYG